MGWMIAFNPLRAHARKIADVTRSQSRATARRAVVSLGNTYTNSFAQVPIPQHYHIGLIPTHPTRGSSRIRDAQDIYI